MTPSSQSTLSLANQSTDRAPVPVVMKPSASRESNRPLWPREKTLNNRLERIESALISIDQAARKLSDLRTLNRARADRRLRCARVRSDLRRGILRDFKNLSPVLRALAEDVRTLAPRQASDGIFDDSRLLIELVSYSSDTARALLENPAASKAASLTLARLWDSLCNCRSSFVEDSQSGLHGAPSRELRGCSSILRIEETDHDPY